MKNASRDVLLVFVAVTIFLLTMVTVSIISLNRVAEQNHQNTDRILKYQRCVSLLRYENGDMPLTPKQIDQCQS